MLQQTPHIPHSQELREARNTNEQIPCTARGWGSNYLEELFFSLCYSALSNLDAKPTAAENLRQRYRGSASSCALPARATDRGTLHPKL